MPFEKRKWKFRIRRMLAVIEENRRFVQGMSYPDFCADATRRFPTAIAGIASKCSMATSWNPAIGMRWRRFQKPSA